MLEKKVKTVNISATKSSTSLDNLPIPATLINKKEITISQDTFFYNNKSITNDSLIIQIGQLDNVHTNGTITNNASKIEMCPYKWSA